MGELEQPLYIVTKITQFNNFAFQDQQVLSNRTLQKVSLRTREAEVL